MELNRTVETRSGKRLNLRRARSEDAPIIRAFIIDRLRAENIEPDMQGLNPDLEHIYDKYSGTNGYFGLLETVDGSLVGAVSVAKLNDELCELRKMYLADSLRGQGVGKNLLFLRLSFLDCADLGK